MSAIESRDPGYRLGRRPAFDGVRALAVGAVLLFHAGAHVDAGFYGVDVFFVLSGFLITSLLLDEQRATRRIDLRSFYIRRIRRLLPALVATLAIVGVELAIWGGETAANAVWEFVAILFYVANWLLALNAHGNLASGLLNPTWSLAIEEQFYLLWPVTLIALLRRRISRRRLVVTIALCACASSILRVALWSHTNFAYFATPTHADGILAGCALALAIDAWFRSRAFRVASSSLVCAAAGVLAMGAAVADPEPRWAVFPLVVVAATFVVAHIALVERSRATRLLALPPLRWMGERSYGIYLYQVPLLDGLFPHLHGAGRVRTVAACGAVLAVADASYRFIETPIRRRRSGSEPDSIADANRPLG